MTEPPIIPFPTSPYCRVRARVATIWADGPDEGTHPDWRPAVGERVTLTPSIGEQLLVFDVAGPAPIIVTVERVRCEVDADGWLVHADGRPVFIAPTDDPTLSATGWTWTATIKGKPVVFSAPTGGVVDLALFVATPAVNAVEYVSVVQIVADYLTANPPTAVSDHGALTGLADDDHPQYHTDARGDARYSPLGHEHTIAAASETTQGIVELATIAETTTGTDKTRAVTPAGVKALADTKAAASHKHAVTDLTATGTRDATTYLRGDNTWATPAGGGGVLVPDSAVSLLLADPDSATTAAMRAGIPRTTAFVPLSIPISDGNPSTGHPSVVTHPSGATWNGYRYWMAHTPFPSDVRENPEICASNDGVNWVVPTGLVNPISTLQRAYDMGYDYWADTELTWSPDGTQLWCYFKGTKTAAKNEFLRQTSTDGITWTPAALVVTHAEMAGVSPAIVRNPTNYEMFDFRDNSMYRRTSTDGITWSARVKCTIPALPATTSSWWHLAVVKRDGIYHALPTTSGGPNVQRHYYWTSTDGQTWTQTNPAPAIPLSVTRFDEGGHYRATFLPARSGMAGLWDVWLTCKDKSAGEIWRLGHLRDYDLTGSTNGWPFAPPPGIELSRASNEVVVQARSAYTISGSPLTAPVGPWGVIGLSKTVSGMIGVTFPPMPEDWQGYCIEALMVTDVAGGGTASLSAGIRVMYPETNMLWTTGGVAPPLAPLDSNRPQWRRILGNSSTLIARPGAMVAAQIGRNFGNPADTLGGPLYFLAFRLRRLPLAGSLSTYHT